MANQTISKTRTMILLALLIAIIMIMSFTPLGYFRTATIEITLIPIPVVVGAIIMGPTAGLLLGAVFGLTSFMQCFGLSQFGVALLAINPFLSFVVSFFPRLLMGWFTGLLFKWLQNFDKRQIWSVGVTSLCGALFNTFLFMGALVMLFGRTDYVGGMIAEQNFFIFVVVTVGINGILEAVTCLVLGSAVSKALLTVRQRNTA